MTLEDKTQTPLPMITMCCVCKSTKNYRGIYINLSDPVRKYIEKNYKVSHTYCPKCVVSETKRYGFLLDSEKYLTKSEQDS